MATFVMVMNGVNAQQLEKILGIQAKSANKVRFVPQGGSQSAVTSQALSEAHGQNGPNHTASFNNVRLEWGEDGATHAREAFDLFIKEAPKAA